MVAEPSNLLWSYHNKEWGRPSRSDGHLFEMISLEGAQVTQWTKHTWDIGGLLLHSLPPT